MAMVSYRVLVDVGKQETVHVHYEGLAVQAHDLVYRDALCLVWRGLCVEPVSSNAGIYSRFPLSLSIGSPRLGNKVD